MLGNRSSLQQVIKSKYTDVEDNIKRVDIDIFSDGRIKNIMHKYVVVSKTFGSSPFVISFYGEDTLVVHFKISGCGIDFNNDSIVSLLMDSETECGTQMSEDDSGQFALAIVYPQTEGDHTLELTMRSGKTFSYKFFVISKEIEYGSTIDIPQVSYRPALLNVVRLWLLSRKNDRIRHPGWAGFFDNRLGEYSMDANGAASIAKDLKAAIIDKIENVYISDVSATPLVTQRGWDVQVTSVDTETLITTGAYESAKKDTHFIVSKDDENVVSVKEVEP